jgi:pSer/pThr/pTyr-binding forkhead associated (FHA) protein
VSPEPVVHTEPLVIIKTPGSSPSQSSPKPDPTPIPSTASVPQQSVSSTNVAPPIPTAEEPVTSEQVSLRPPTPPSPTASASSRTQLQQQTAKLLHVQTNAIIELQPNLSVIHIGKPNDRIPPDVDVSGFPNSEIVSRIHADIRVEGDAFYIEDVGSANGTYINNLPLLPGNRHRLRAGDRIALGKGDLVTLLFQLS